MFFMWRRWRASARLLGTRNVMAAAKKHGVKKIVYSSSSSVYGLSDILPLREDFKISALALNPYASTKHMGEMLMYDLGKITHGPETVCLRYFNVYGPRQTTVKDGAYATVVGIFMDLAIARGKPLPIVPDGYQRRAFTWVGDVVRANILAMNQSGIGNADIFNIGSDSNYSVWDVARLILKVSPDITGEELIKNGKCVFAPKRHGEVRETLADISKAEKILGWRPQVDFTGGINRLLKNYPK
ncbi:MAG: NAD-dependent epimerase/dehydratase [Parcubacteria group bacterium Athens0714_26]|nr:MAG: NAD-dependent epimerase/dehydratase [Parcubacteria group bacterium Athens0714_26]